MPKHLEDIPLWKLAVGLFIIVVGLCFVSFGLLTTEDLMMHGNGGGIVISWSCLTQIWGLVLGQYQGLRAVAVLLAWFFLVMYLILGYMEINSPKASTKHKILQVGCVIIMILDGYANYEYLRNARPEYQWAVMIAYSLMMTLGGKFGAELVLSALGEMF